MLQTAIPKDFKPIQFDDGHDWLLICEGPLCNPALAAFDHEAARIRRETRNTDDETCRRWTPDLVELRKMLRYTPHVNLGGQSARCVHCGQARAYGR